LILNLILALLNLNSNSSYIYKLFYYSKLLFRNYNLKQLIISNYKKEI